MISIASWVGIGLAMTMVPRDVWLPVIGKEIRRFDDSVGTESLAVSSDGSQLLIVGSKGASVWSPDGNVISRLKLDPQIRLQPISFTNDGKEVFAAGGWTAHVRWDAKTGEVIRVQKTIGEELGHLLISNAYRWLEPQRHAGESQSGNQHRILGQIGIENEASAAGLRGGYFAVLPVLAGFSCLLFIDSLKR